MMQNNVKSESCLFRKIITEKKYLREIAYVDHLYLKKTLLNHFLLLAYGESCHYGGRKPVGKNHKTSTMQHSWVLIYVLNGKGNILVNDKWNNVGRGDILLLPPFTGKNTLIEKGEKMENIYLCIYDTKVMESMGGVLALPAAGVLHFPGENQQKILNKYFSGIKENILTASPHSDTARKLSLQLYDLFYYLSESIAARKKDDDFQTFLQTLSAVPAQNHTLKSLADLLQKDPRTVLRLFKKHTGRSPMEYLRDMKMEYAAKLLREGDPYFSMEDIARAGGYKSISAFSYAFKNKYHLTPRKYKTQYSPERGI